MSKRNDDFFAKKKPWSEVKDQLLGCYFAPYVQKILYTRKPLVYVDCFAGKGKFDDGNPGSPLIALQKKEECCAMAKLHRLPRISFNFIDLNYAADLQNNLRDYPDVNIISGAYEENIDGLLEKEVGSNVFLYIDPYGIKALDCSKFDSFAKEKFNTIELLINMNSFGFIREACHVMGQVFQVNDNDFFGDLVEYEPTKLVPKSHDSVMTLNQIAGGEYWKEIIQQYIEKKIDGYQAEEQFAEKYCVRLNQSYKYVLNMPIRIHKNQHTKYRMVHATNHPYGCLLMVDNICKRWKLLNQMQNKGQLSLFKEDLNNNIIDESQIKEKIIKFFSQYIDWIGLSEAEALFFTKYGAICKTGDLGKILKELEDYGQIEVKRSPKTTKTGRPL